MRILNAEIWNFRVIAHAEIRVGGEPFLICGPNMTGKSTAAEAIVWALCDSIPADVRVTKEMIRPSLPIAAASGTEQTKLKKVKNGVGDTVVEVTLSCPIFENSLCIGEERILVRRSLQGAALKMNLEIVINGCTSYRSDMAQAMLYARAGIRSTERESEAQKAFLRMVWLGVGQDETFFKAKPSRKREILEMSNPVTILDKAFKESQNILSQRQKDQDQKALEEAKFRGMFESKVGDLGALLQQDASTLSLLGVEEESAKQAFLACLKAREIKPPAVESELLELMSTDVNFLGGVEEKVALATLAAKASDKMPDVLRSDIRLAREETGSRQAALGLLENVADARERTLDKARNFAEAGGDQALKEISSEIDNADLSKNYYAGQKSTLTTANSRVQVGIERLSMLQEQMVAAELIAQDIETSHETGLKRNLLAQECLALLVTAFPDIAAGRKARPATSDQAWDELVIALSKLGESTGSQTVMDSVRAFLASKNDGNFSHSVEAVVASLEEIRTNRSQWEDYEASVVGAIVVETEIQEDLKRQKAETTSLRRRNNEQIQKLKGALARADNSTDANCDHCGGDLSPDHIRLHLQTLDSDCSSQETILALIQGQINESNNRQAVSEAEIASARVSLQELSSFESRIINELSTVMVSLENFAGLDMESQRDKQSKAVAKLKSDIHSQVDKDASAVMDLAALCAEVATALGLTFVDESPVSAQNLIEECELAAAQWGVHARELHENHRILQRLADEASEAQKSLELIEKKIPPALRSKSKHEIEFELAALARRIDQFEADLIEAERTIKLRELLGAVTMNRSQWTLLRTGLNLIERELVSLGRVKALLSPSGAARDYLIARDRDFVELQANHYIRLFDPAIVPVVKLTSSEDSGKSALDINVEVSGAVMPKLSNSQRGLVEICLEVAMRELSPRPDFLFIDEPENGFDAENKPKLEAFLHKITQQPIYITNAQSNSFHRSVHTNSYQSFLRGATPGTPRAAGGE